MSKIGQNYTQIRVRNQPTATIYENFLLDANRAVRKSYESQY